MHEAEFKSFQFEPREKFDKYVLQWRRLYFKSLNLDTITVSISSSQVFKFWTGYQINLDDCDSAT